MSHPLMQSDQAGSSPSNQSNQPAAPVWPRYGGTSQYVGTSPSGKVRVFVDPSQGPPALQNAQDLLNDADRVVAANEAIFGTASQPVSAIIYALSGATDGTGGADHNGCDFPSGGAIEVCASFGNSARVSALFAAELSECSMGGHLCGCSTGEALSRWCAAVIGNHALSAFATAPRWYQSGAPDYVNQTDPTDQHPDSVGCGMAFLSWLMSLGHTLSEIARTMVSLGNAGTLAQLYARLNKGAQNAWPKFITAVRSLANGVTSDDPFGGGSQPAQMAHIAPWTVELSGRIFGAILADLCAGKDEHQIAASVRAQLCSAPTASSSAVSNKYCGAQSRLLVPPLDAGPQTGNA
jgi:hypothetical protein